MATSFPVGLAKIETGTHPRFVVLAGNEFELKNRIIKAFNIDNVNLVSVDAADKAFLPTVFTQGIRTSKETKIHIRNASQISDWTWLARWFNQVKRMSLLVDADVKLADKLTKIANTRGIVIDCSAPSGERAKTKMVNIITKWYNESPTQVNLLLNKNNWKISPCLQLLDKLALLNLRLSSDTIMSLGVAHNPREEFVEALIGDNPALSLTVIERVPFSEYRWIVDYLSEWLDKLARTKGSQSAMKSVNEIAFETGVSSKETEQIVKIGRRYDLLRVNKIALALANADTDISRGNRQGVLELLASKW